MDWTVLVAAVGVVITAVPLAGIWWVFVEFVALAVVGPVPWLVVGAVEDVGVGVVLVTGFGFFLIFGMRHFLDLVFITSLRR